MKTRNPPRFTSDQQRSPASRMAEPNRAPGVRSMMRIGSLLRSYWTCRPTVTFFLGVVFGCCLGHRNGDCFEQNPTTRFVQLLSPWQSDDGLNRTFEVSLSDTRLSLRGVILDSTISDVDPIHDTAPAKARDCILFAWSHSSLGLTYDGLEIYPDGQYTIWASDAPGQSKARISIDSTETLRSERWRPEIRVERITGGLRLECDIVWSNGADSVAPSDESWYLSLAQVDVASEDAPARWYCANAPAVLRPMRFPPSSFVRFDKFSLQREDDAASDRSASSQNVVDSFRVAELELRSKWENYANDPNQTVLAQKWYENIAAFPDAERFLELTKQNSNMVNVSVGTSQSSKRLTDARSESITKLLGQSWSVHISGIEDLNASLPLVITKTLPSQVSSSRSAVPQSESLMIWMQNDRLHIALTQNGQNVYWGSANCSEESTGHTKPIDSLTLVSDGSMIGVGYTLYANLSQIDLISHTPINLELPNDVSLDVRERNGSSLKERVTEKDATVGNWSVFHKKEIQKIDLYNTGLTPIEILSLDPAAILVSWPELNEKLQEAWRDHFVRCVDPEGRYFLESLKHYTSSQAELQRRSGNPSEK